MSLFSEGRLDGTSVGRLLGCVLLMALPDDAISEAFEDLWGLWQFHNRPARAAAIEQTISTHGATLGDTIYQPKMYLPTE